MFTKYRKGGTMGVKTIDQIINEKSSQETIMQEQKIGTSDLETYYYTGKMFTKYRKGGTMGVKTIDQIAQEKGKSLRETTTREQKYLTSKLETSNLEIETYYYDAREYLKGKYYNLSNIIPGLHKRTFENSNTKSKKEKEHKESFERYCENFEDIKIKGLGIIMLGNAGNGKTFYSDCIFNDLLSKGYVVYRTTISSLFQRFKDTYNPNSKVNIKDLIKELKECDLIVLDDLGSENISENWGEENIYNLLDFLTTNNISLILSSNLSLEDLKNHLSVKKDGKLLDRIREKCKLFVFDWESRRGDTYKKEFEELY